MRVGRCTVTAYPRLHPSPAPPLDLRVEWKVYRRPVGAMRISELAERVSVPATTLRFDETAGSSPAGRTPAGHRVFGEDAVDRLAFIGVAERLGSPPEEITEL